MPETRELERLLKTAEKSLLDDATGPDALRTLLDAFGGFPKVAKALKRQFDGLPKGHPAKIQLLMMITNAAIKHNPNPTGTGDLADNEAQLAKLLKELQPG